MNEEIKKALDACFGLMMQVDHEDGRVKSMTVDQFNESRANAEKQYYEVISKYSGYNGAGDNIGMGIDDLRDMTEHD